MVNKLRAPLIIAEFLTFRKLLWGFDAFTVSLRECDMSKIETVFVDKNLFTMSEKTQKQGK